MPGPSDGCPCERARLFCTNTVSGYPLRTVAIAATRHPDSTAPGTPWRPRPHGMSQLTLLTQLGATWKPEGPRLFPGAYSGRPDGGPLVPSEKNVDACVVSSELDQV